MMSKIDELIKQYCPDDVEFKYLWELTAWDKKFNAVDRNKQKKVIDYHYFLAGDLKPLIRDNGKVKLLTTNVSELFTDEELVAGFVSEGEVVCIPWGGNPIVQYYKGKFVTADNRIATSLNTKVLDNKYLYYVLMNRLKEISSFYRGSGIKHPDMSKVLDLRIPVPPKVVQEEIVKILDNFSELTTELTTELTARKQQYDFYRDKLLTFEDNKVDYLPLGSVVNVLRGKRLTKDMLSNDEKYPVYHGGLEPLGYYGHSNREGDTVMVINVGASAGTVGYSKVDFWSSDGCFCLSKSERIRPKFLYHSLLTKESVLQSKVRKAGIPTLDAKVIENILIPIPSLQVQERIVNVLDNFDKICSDLGIGLPAEIEARQKQYEYYREKLLTFDNKVETLLTEPNRTEPNRTEPNRTEPNRTEPN